MKKFLLPILSLPLLLITSCTDILDKIGGDDDVPRENLVEIVCESFDTDAPETYLLGYNSAYLKFEHFLNEEYGYWGGFAHSSMHNMEDGSYTNQYSVYNHSGDGFMLFYYDSYNPTCDILCRYFGDYEFSSVLLNLSTYTHQAITEGNDFARAFTDGDYLKVTFTALHEDKREGKSVDCYVADYREGRRFVADAWNSFDLSELRGELWGLRVKVETTDVGEYGANTPLYICMDNLIYKVELDD